MLTAVLLWAILAVCLLIAALLFALLRRPGPSEWRELQEDLRSLQTRLRATDTRFDAMYEEIEDLASRSRTMQDILVRVTDQLSRTRRVIISEHLSDPPPEPGTSDQKPGRTVYDHLMADDDPDVS